MFGPVRMTSCAGRPIERHVVRHERVGHVTLDDRVARLRRGELRRRRAREASCSWRSPRRRPGRRARRARRCACAVSRMRAASARHGRSQRLEQRQLANGNALVGVEHPVLELLERRRREAFAAGDRLLAVVVGGHGGEVRSRDLDVVPEDAVEPNLERADAGARAFGLFHRRDRGLAAPADVAEFVQFGIDAVANHARIPRERGRLVGERALDAVAHVGRGRRSRPPGSAPAAPGVARRGRGRAESSASDWPSASKSRGPAVPSDTRATSRSRSCTCLSRSSNLPRSVVRNAKSSTASRRS